MDTEPFSWLEYFEPGGIPYAAAILIVTSIAAGALRRSSERLGERFADRRLVIQQSGALLRFTVFFVGFTAAALTLFTLEQELLIAIGGTLAVAFGFAAKDLAASVLAGVIILVDRPFQVGDRVTFEGFYGEITTIGLRSVRLMTLDDTQVTIPNSKFLTEAVASGNAGAVDMMVQIDLHIGIDQDLDEARRLLSEVLTCSRYVNLNQKWSVTASQVIRESYFAVRLLAKAYVLDVRYEKAFETDVTGRALAAFREAGIEPPAVLHRGI